jgi:hypothetical protein
MEKLKKRKENKRGAGMVCGMVCCGHEDAMPCYAMVWYGLGQRVGFLVTTTLYGFVRNQINL